MLTLQKHYYHLENCLRLSWIFWKHHINKLLLVKPGEQKDYIQLESIRKKIWVDLAKMIFWVSKKK